MIPIVKIKGLPLSAKSKDIRALFSGLLIPDGAVHVIGGPEGLAFIAFGTFEDAKQAVMFPHAEIHGCPIITEWSTDSEMYKVISEILRTRNQGVLSNELADHSPCKTFSNWRGVEMQPETPVSCYQDSSYYSSSSTSPYSGLGFTNQKNDDIRENSFYKQQIFTKPYQVSEHPPSASNVQTITGISTESLCRREQQEKQKFYYVRLSNFPAEVSTTAALEAFLDPSVPLRLSSVKTIFDRNRFPYCFLVRLENVDDMQNALDKDGEKGIKIQACSQAYFNNAVDGSVRKAKTDGGKIDSYSSEDEATVKREKKNASGRTKAFVVRSRSRSPLVGKHVESKRSERERSPEQRHSDGVNNSRKRKERNSERDRRGDYDRVSPKHRWKKPSPKKLDHSPAGKRPDRENMHCQVSLNGNSLKDSSQQLIGPENSISKTGRSESNDRVYSYLSPSEKDDCQEFIADSLHSSIESVKRKRCVSSEQQRDDDSALDLDSSCNALGCISEVKRSKPSQSKVMNDVPCVQLSVEDPSRSGQEVPVTEHDMKSGEEGGSSSSTNNSRLKTVLSCETVNDIKCRDMAKNTCNTGVRNRFCVEFTNLPLSVTEDEVKDYLGCLCSNASIRRACFRDGKPSDRWIAVFNSEESAERACHIFGEIQGQIIVPKKLLEQEADLLLEGAKPVSTTTKESAQKDLAKIKFSLTKEKLSVKQKQEKASSVHGSGADNISNVIAESKVKNELTVTTAGKNEAGDTVINEPGSSYQGATYGSRNEQLWHLYNQYCQTYYATTNGPIDYMQTNVHGIHPSRGRPVLIPNGPAEFCAPYQYLGACFPSQVSPDTIGIDQIPFGSLHPSKYLQRGVPPRFRSPATYSASPLLYKRRGAGGYEAKGVLNSDKSEKQKCHNTSGTAKDLVYPMVSEAGKIEREKIEAK